MTAAQGTGIPGLADFSADSLAASAGMSRAEYSEYIRGLRARPLAEKMGVFGTIADAIAAPELVAREYGQGDGGTGTRRHVPVAVALTDDEVATFLLGLGRKVELDEVTGSMVNAAERWLAAYTGDFEFLVDVRRKATRGLSNGQAKGVLNCWRADLVRSARTAAPAPETRTSTAPQAARPDVPAGHYATASRTGNNDLDFFRVDRPTEGRWAGYTFVKRVIGGHEDQRLDRTQSALALEAIAAAGPAAAGRLYGQEVGRCCRCQPPPDRRGQPRRRDRPGLRHQRVGGRRVAKKSAGNRRNLFTPGRCPPILRASAEHCRAAPRTTAHGSGGLPRNRNRQGDRKCAASSSTTKPPSPKRPQPRRRMARR